MVNMLAMNTLWDKLHQHHASGTIIAVATDATSNVYRTFLDLWVLASTLDC